MPDSQNLQTCGCGPGCFFLLWPLFARAPRHWFLENFLLSAPGVQSVFFCCAPLGAATFRRGQSKKKTPPRVFSFLLRPRGWRSPVGSRHGARAKKKTPPRVFFFCCGPGERQGKEKPRWNGARATKKNTNQGVFFLLRPRGKAGEGEAPLGAGTGPEQKVFFFFALAPCRLPTGLLLPLPFAGAGAKKKTPWVVFFFLLRPRADAHALTAGLGGDASPSPGRCFFLLRPRPDRGGVFFFCCGPARTLTHSRWAGAISARPGWCFFFCCGPAGSF